MVYYQGIEGIAAGTSYEIKIQPDDLLMISFLPKIRSSQILSITEYGEYRGSEESRC
jgi:hypothetical protein